MRRLANQMKLNARLSNEYVNPVIGFISSYDPDNYCCKVTISPEDSVSDSKEVVSGWIPLGSIWVGNGWGLFCPPSIGDMVEVDFQESDFNAGHVDWRFYNDEVRPVHAESGVFYIIHKTGSSFKFNNDGSVDLVSHTDLRVTVGGNLTATVAGTTDVESTGNAIVKSPHVTVDSPLTSCTGNLSVAGGITCTGSYGASGGKIVTPGDIQSTGGNVSDSVRSIQADRLLDRAHTHADPQGGRVSIPTGGM